MMPLTPPLTAVEYIRPDGAEAKPRAPNMSSPVMKVLTLYDQAPLEYVALTCTSKEEQEKA